MLRVAVYLYAIMLGLHSVLESGLLLVLFIELLLAEASETYIGLLLAEASECVLFIHVVFDRKRRPSEDIMESEDGSGDPPSIVAAKHSTLGR